MRKKINYLRHFGVLMLTIMIFIVGTFIGTSVEQLRVNNLYTNLQDQDLAYQNILTESYYLDYIITLKENNENVSCDLIRGAYQTSIENLDSSRIKLENYINAGADDDEEFYRLKDHYANIQINYWILANRISKQCDNDFDNILFFYSDKEKCPECEDQGIHLDYVKKKLGDNVLIFNLDSQKTGPTKLLAQKYGVFDRGVPTLVINEKTYGFLENAAIFEALNVSFLD